MATASTTSADMITEATFPTVTENVALETSNASLGAVDIVVVAVYVVATFALGIWVSCRGSRKTIQSYFLAGQSVTWLPVGASLFASNIGCVHFVGLAGVGASGGLAMGLVEWLAPFLILQLGWVFLPVYKSSKVYTMPEYISKRYGGSRLRVILSVVSLAMYVLTKVAVDLYSGAIFIQQAFNINLYVAIVSLLLITSIYTVLGGLKAVIYTDAVQTVVMLAGGLLLMVLSFIEIGGYDNLEEMYMKAIPQTTKVILESGNHTTCGVPREDSMHVLRDPISSDLPWPGMILGMYCFGSWYWCTDQVIVQRSLAAKTPKDAKAGCILAGALKILPVYMIVMTGMISRVLFPDEVACADPIQCDEVCGNKQGCSNIAYPKLVLELLPTGLKGIMVSAILSALMSSLTSIFNSASSIFTIDVWKRIRKTASEREMLIVGKVTICFLVVISILWIPVVLSSAGGLLFVYLNSVQSALGPPITVLFLLGVIWPRINETGAFWGLMSGFAVGFVRLVLDNVYPMPGCDQEDTRPSVLSSVNFMYVAPIVFLVSSVVTIVVSYLTKPLSRTRLQGTTWFTIEDQDEKQSQELHSDYKDEENQLSAADDGNDNTKKSDILEIRSQQTHVDRKKVFFDLSFLLNFLAITLCLALTFLLGYYA